MKQKIQQTFHPGNISKLIRDGQAAKAIPILNNQILDSQQLKGKTFFNKLLTMRACSFFYNRQYMDSEIDFLNIIQYKNYKKQDIIHNELNLIKNALHFNLINAELYLKSIQVKVSSNTNLSITSSIDFLWGLYFFYNQDYLKSQEKFVSSMNQQVDLPEKVLCLHYLTLAQMRNTNFQLSPDDFKIKIVSYERIFQTLVSNNCSIHDFKNPLENFQYILSYQSPVQIQLFDLLMKKELDINIHFIDILYKLAQLCLMQKSLFFKETGSQIIRKCQTVLNENRSSDNKIKLLQAAYSYDVKSYDNANAICQKIIQSDCENNEDSNKQMAFNIMIQIAKKYNQDTIVQELDSKKQEFSLKYNISQWANLLTEMPTPSFDLSELNLQESDED